MSRPGQQFPERDQTLQSLAAAAAGGDDAAFDELYRRLHAGVCRFLQRRCGHDAHRVEELAQQSWVAVCKALRGGRYRPERAAITTYVYAVAYKHWLQARRTAGRGRVAADGLPELVSEGGPEAELAEAESIESAWRALHDRSGPHALTEVERAVIIGAFVRGRSVRQLAEELGYSASVVVERKQSAIRKLRCAIEPSPPERPTSGGQ